LERNERNKEIVGPTPGIKERNERNKRFQRSCPKPWVERMIERLLEKNE